MVPTPSESATRRIETASRPSASAIAMAAAVIRSTVMPGLRPRAGAGLVPQSRAIVSAETAPPPKLAAFSVLIAVHAILCVQRTHF
jgi:hypothetical protein